MSRVRHPAMMMGSRWILGGVFAIGLAMRIRGRGSRGGSGRGSCMRLVMCYWRVWNPRTSPLSVFSCIQWSEEGEHMPGWMNRDRRKSKSKLCGVHLQKLATSKRLWQSSPANLKRTSRIECSFSATTYILIVACSFTNDLHSA